MDRHHNHPQLHHSHHHLHHQQQRQIQFNPEFMESRHFPPRPPLLQQPQPQPPPPSFLPHRHHLPPPPPPPRLPPPSLPPPPCIFHHPPQPSLPHHHHHHHSPRRQDVNFLDSPSHHHHRQHTLLDFPPSSNPRVSTSRAVVFDDDRRSFLPPPPPPRLPPLDFDLDHHRRRHHHHRRHSPIIHHSVNMDRMSPPPPPPPPPRPRFFDDVHRHHHDVVVDDDDHDVDRFRIQRDIVRSPPRFQEDFNLESPLHPDEFRDHRRIIDNVVIDDRDHRYRHHEQYHPEVLLSEFELDSGRARPPLLNHDDEDMLVEDVNVNVGGRSCSRDMSRSPIKFRNNRGIDVNDGFYDQGMSRGGSELGGRYADRGQGEEMQGYMRKTSKKIPQKKSAFLRIQQPLKQTRSSPHKYKESSQYLDRRSSQERGVSPVELDVSFKSNALVAKPIMGNQSSLQANHNEDLGVSELDTRIIGSENPLKIESVKDSENSSRKDRKHLMNRARVSFTLKKVGNKGNVEVHDNNSESSSSGSSNLSGSSVHSGSLIGEILDKDGNKISPQSARKRRKSKINPSRLSGSVPAKTDEEGLNLDISHNQPSGSWISDKVVNKLKEDSSSSGQVIESIQSEAFEETVKVGPNESPLEVEVGVTGHSVSEESFPKKKRKRVRSELFTDSLTQESSKKATESAEAMLKTSNSDELVTKSLEKYSCDIGTECNDGKDQDVAPLFVDPGSGGRSSEPMACLGVDMDSINVHSGEVSAHSSAVVANATSSPVHVSDRTPEKLDSPCSVDKASGTKVDLSPEIDIVGLSYGDQHFDKGNNQSESRNCGEFANYEKFSNIDSYSCKANAERKDFGVFSVSKKLTTASDISSQCEFVEQKCQDADTTSVLGNSGGEPSKNPDSLGCDLSAFLEGKDIFLPNRKRKATGELDSLVSGVSESSHEYAVKDSAPAEKMSGVVSASPSSIAESNVLLSNELIESRMCFISSSNIGCDSDPVECFTSCSKKQNSLPLEPLSSSALATENHDAVADTIMSVVRVPIDSTENSRPSAVMIGLSNSIPTDNKCSLTDGSKADFLCGDSCLSSKESSHPDDKQPSFLLKSSRLEENMIVKMSESGNRNRGIALESENRLVSNHSNDAVSNLGPDLNRLSDNELPVTDMACEKNVAINRVSPSLSDTSPWCAESICNELTAQSNVIDAPTNMSSTGLDGESDSMLDMSDTVSIVNAMFEKKKCMDDKYSSHSPSLLECDGMKLTSRVLALTSEQTGQKTVTVPSRNAKSTISSPNVMSRRIVRRNMEMHGDVKLSTGHVSSVITPSKAPSAYPAKSRTWHRSDNPTASNTLVKKPIVTTTSLSKPPFDKSIKVQSTSYIRKGHSLVRNPVSASATQNSHARSVSVCQSKPNDTNRIGKIGSSVMVESTVVHDCLPTGGRNTSIEMPKTPPLPYSDNASNCEVLYAGDCSNSSPIVQSEGMDNEEALRSSETDTHISRNTQAVGNRNFEDVGTLSDGNLPASSAKRIVYIKRKSNQLIAASNSPDPSVGNVDKAVTLSSDSSYFKRRKNQLVRASSESNIHQMVAVIDDSSSSQPQRPSDVYMGRSSPRKNTNKVKSPKVSLVWKLGDRKSSSKLLSHLLPWKRATYLRSVWRSSSILSNTSSTKNCSRKLLSLRKRAIVYVRSGRGFSLRRSKVISIAGSSLKWSKSMEKHSKKVNEEVANAIAALDAAEGKKTSFSSVASGAESRKHSSNKPGERIFRIGVYRYRMDPSRRTLHRIPDEELSDSVASKPTKDAIKTYVPKRLLIGSDEYVRIGNGNQLVRDPKRRTRILASEKIRWSLHTARTRLAKKRKFCQFFTRFGKCNKGEGKCPFIHDPSKIAVCTKFLNGLCGDSNCKLTHKVIPERMPDCSFYLQGLCSNESCPYRHVNVNPKASICESFLRGYCAEGNECRKKHSYSCPEFEATGSCLQGSKCKLYHPKKSKGEKRKVSKDKRSARGRYFGSRITTNAETEAATGAKLIAPKNDSPGFQGDYISLDISDDEVEESNETNIASAVLSEREALSCQLDDFDGFMIKPLRLLDGH